MRNRDVHRAGKFTLPPHSAGTMEESFAGSEGRLFNVRFDCLPAVTFPMRAAEIEAVPALPEVVSRTEAE